MPIAKAQCFLMFNTLLQLLLAMLIRLLERSQAKCTSYHSAWDSRYRESIGLCGSCFLCCRCQLDAL